MAAVEGAILEKRAASDERVVDQQKSFTQQQRVAATEELIAQYHADVFRYSYWLSGCAVAAEDITQETFLQAFRGLHGLRDRSAAKSWLLTITRHEFARWCRSRSSDASGEHVFEIADTRDHAVELENEEWLRSAVASLPSEFRLVVLMFYFEQLSYAEIAEQLDIPLGTVMSRLSRGRQHLRKSLEELERPSRD